MATSITASNSAAPFNSLLLTDSNYIVTAALNATNAVTPSVNFNVANPYPTIASTLIYITATDTQTNASGSAIYLQESADNSTWTNAANFAAPIGKVSGSTTFTPVTVNYGTNNSKQYLRLSASNTTGNPTGSVTLTVLM